MSQRSHFDPSWYSSPQSHREAAKTFASSAMDASARTSEGATRTSSAIDTAATSLKVLTRSLPVLYLQYSTALQPLLYLLYLE